MPVLNDPDVPGVHRPVCLMVRSFCWDVSTLALAMLPLLEAWSVRVQMGKHRTGHHVCKMISFEDAVLHDRSNGIDV